MSEHVKPFNTDLPKEPQIQAMFDEIAPHYDFLNRILSLCQDVRWRRMLVQEITSFQPVRVLDVATGTGDVALALHKAEIPEVIGLDISTGMLEIARRRTAEGSGILRFVQGSALHIPFDDNYFDAVSVSFGVRNFENISAGILEMYRVCRPGGRIFILEFSKPHNGFFKKIVSLYNNFIVRRTGALLSKNARAYAYLDESVAAFPSGKVFLDLLERVGWYQSSYKALTGGVVGLYRATK